MVAGGVQLCVTVGLVGGARTPVDTVVVTAAESENRP
jgi:hypothetical protein